MSQRQTPEPGSGDIYIYMYVHMWVLYGILILYIGFIWDTHFRPYTGKPPGGYVAVSMNLVLFGCPSKKSPTIWGLYEGP